LLSCIFEDIISTLIALLIEIKMCSFKFICVYVCGLAQGEDCAVLSVEDQMIVHLQFFKLALNIKALV
tara:strand:- start:283 stop:486 length:204 start_codon:yes stop_codon:yes gene_type:complete